MDREVVREVTEDDRTMTRIVRVRDEIGEISLMTELLQGCLIIDESSDDLPILWDTGLLDEDEISVIDPLLIHGVSLCSEEEVFLRE